MKNIGITGLGYANDFYPIVRELGHNPVDLFTMRQLDEHIGTLAGIILTGGPDVDPVHYGIKPHPSMRVSPPDTLRDQLELELLAIAEEDHIPVLGVCRGHQMIGVHRGMELIPDIHRYHTSSANRLKNPDRYIEHKIHTLDNALFPNCENYVNSLHHQAVPYSPLDLEECSLDPLIVSDHAAEGDMGIVEAMRGLNTFSVQWHPEMDWRQSNISHRVFEIFQEMVESEVV